MDLVYTINDIFHWQFFTFVGIIFEIIGFLYMIRKYDDLPDIGDVYYYEVNRTSKFNNRVWMRLDNVHPDEIMDPKLIQGIAKHAESDRYAVTPEFKQHLNFWHKSFPIIFVVIGLSFQVLQLFFF